MPQLNDLVELERERCRRDFFWFSKNIGGSPDITRRTHGKLCETITKWPVVDGHYKQLILMPRGTFKSSIISEDYPAWLIGENPNIRIYIGSEGFEKSAKFVEAIQERLKRKEYIDIYGDMGFDAATNKRTKWAKFEFRVTKRTGKALFYKEETVSAGSPDCAASGTAMHYDIIILDDAVSEKTVTTKAQMSKTLDYYRKCLSLLEPGGKMIIVGTRYDYDDLYGHLLKEELCDDVIVESSFRADGSLFFPERLNEKTLESYKMNLGMYKYSCQYENNPVNKDAKLFHCEKIKKFWESMDNAPDAFCKVLPTLRITFMFCDPAQTEGGEYADYSAITILSVDNAKDVYVRFSQQRRCSTSELIDWIFDLYNLFTWDHGYIESFSFGKTIESWFKEKMREPGRRFVPLQPLKLPKTSKEARIRGMEPYFSCGKVLFVEGLTDLEDQLDRFPSLKHDDLIDSLSMFPNVIYPPSETKEDDKVEPWNIARRPDPADETPNWVEWGIEDGNYIH